MRALAIDLGDRRTGLAVSDSITGIATPIGQLEIPIDRAGGEDLLAALVRTIDEQLNRNDAVVLGFPLNMDGTEGPRAKVARAFAARLAERTGRAITLVDERRTSVAAEERLNQSGLTHKQKKNRRDAIAAAEILRAFLAGQESGETHETVKPAGPETVQQQGDGDVKDGGTGC